MYKSYSLELAGRTLTVDIGRVAEPAEVIQDYTVQVSAEEGPRDESSEDAATH